MGDIGCTEAAELRAVAVVTIVLAKVQKDL